MEQLATAARPLRIAIIGAGPAGLYAAETLLKQPGLSARPERGLCDRLAITATITNTVLFTSSSSAVFSTS